MHLKSLNAFLMTAELKSFSAASRVLGLTPAAVSKSIGELEQTLGIRLFHRNTRNLSLTEDGHKLLLAISPALNTLEQALSQSKSVEMEPTGKLKINIPESFGKKFILPLLPEFLRRYPLIELDIHLQDKKLDPVSEAYDISIGNLDDTDSGLVSRELCQLELVTIASPAYLDTHSAPKTPADLSHHSLVGYRQLSTGRIVNWRYKNGQDTVTVSPDGHLTVSNIEAVVMCVQNGLGIGSVGRWLVKDALQKGELVQLLKKYKRAPLPVKIYFASRNQQAKKVRVFIDFLLEMKKSHFFE